MCNLRHSYAGYLRLMQMSAIQLYVFVEGKQCDPYFFAEACSATLGSQVTYEIVIARKLPGNSGGKQALLSFFIYLRGRSSLITILGGNKTACIFFLDKDLDDLQRRKKRSMHVVYTQHYDVQNYVFEHGDLTKGSAVAASIDPHRLESDLDDSSQWCRQIAILWRDWVALCMQMIIDGIPCEANYRVLSPVQTRLCGPVDPVALNAFTSKIARRHHIPVAELRNKLGSYIKRIDHYLKRGEHHRVFKGKWFVSILADDIDRIMGGDFYDNDSLARRLQSTITATLDFSEPWADYFKQSLIDIANML